MKKLVFLLLLCLAPPAMARAADVAVQSMTATTAPLSTDIFYIVVDPAGTPLDRKVTGANLGKALTLVGKVTLTQPATGSTFTLLDGKTFTVNKTLTLDGTDGTTMTFPSTSATIARTDAANTFTGVQTMTSPVLITPVLGAATGTSLDITGAFTAGSSGGVSGKLALSGSTSGTCNLTVTATGTAITPSVAAECDFGTTTLPIFKDLYFAGTSATPATNNFKLTGASTSGTRVITAGDGPMTIPLTTSPSFTTPSLVGPVLVSNSGGSIRFEGATSSFPMITRSTAFTTHMAARLADSSAWAEWDASAFNGMNTASQRTAVVNGVGLSNAGAFLLASGGGYGWSSSATEAQGGIDTILCRQAAGVVQVGSGSTCGAGGTFRGLYQSSDGTAGATVTTCTGYKNGLCISGT